MNNEPVAWINKTGSHGYLEWDKDDEVDESIPLYTHPVKELTDAEMEEVIRKHWNKEYGNRNMLTLCKAVLKESQEKCNGFCGEYECKENQSNCKRKASEK